MSDAIVLDVADATPVRLDAGDADPIARQEIAELAGRVTTVEGDVSGLSTRVGAAEGDISTLGTTVDGIDARVEAIEADGSVTPAKLADTPFPSLLAGAAQSLTGDEPTEATFLDRACPGTTGQATVQSVRGNTVVQDGSLLPVRMEGIETVGFNRWDEVWDNGDINSSTGQSTSGTTVRSKGYVPVTPGLTYYFKCPVGNMYLWAYEADKGYLGRLGPSGLGNTGNVANATVTIPETVRFVRFRLTDTYGTTYKHDICINLSDPARNGTYEPHWRSERAIPASTYFPDGMRSAGTVRDELTETQAITRVGSVDLGTLTWAKGKELNDGTGTVFYCAFASSTKDTGIPRVKCDKLNPVKYTTPYEDITKDDVFTSGTVLVVGGDSSLTAAAFKTAMSGVMLHYALATPTTTPIDPTLNLTYRAESGGTERITHTEQSAPPVLSVAYGHTADGIVREAASAIAAQDGPTATTNHAIGGYLTMGGTLYRVTTAIATGEAITPGTNVTATTVMAEVLSLIQ